MIKGYYLYWHNIEDNANFLNDGVDLKVAGQINSLRCDDLDCQLYFYKRTESRIGKVLMSLPLASDGNVWPEIVDIREIDFIYIRKPRFISNQMIKWLKDQKDSNRDLRILLELPTFPYDSEMLKPTMLAALHKDRIARKRLHECIERIVTMTNDKRIFDVPTIHMINGIDLSRVKIRCHDKKHAELSLICTASFARWHGVDRLLEGMADYYLKAAGKRKIMLNLVGDGPALPELKRQAVRLGVSDYVVFHGRMTPEDFAPIYDRCDLAIECLGNHRKGITVSSSLKSREYLAKGVPFVYSGEIDVFLDEPVDFCLQVPADDSPIDVAALVEFTDSLYARESARELTLRIRTYAERHVSMDVAMKPVVDYLKGSESEHRNLIKSL